MSTTEPPKEITAQEALFAWLDSHIQADRRLAIQLSTLLAKIGSWKLLQEYSEHIEDKYDPEPK